MQKSCAKGTIELATGTESLIHPATPDGPDSMALAIKGNSKSVTLLSKLILKPIF